MLRVGTILHGTYRVDGYLASGGFGNTYVATNIQFGERYAIKEFFLKGVTERDENTTTISVSNQENAATFEAQRDKFKKEAVRLRKLSSPHIVCVHDLFEENGTAYYVMDFVDGENLRDYLKKIGHPLDEATVWQVFDQVLDALEVVHSHGLFHLDLKPANLMMDQQGGVRLIDFGASKQMKAFGEFFNNQIEYATTVILSRSQNATPEQLEFCVNKIQELNPKAAIITTDWAKLSGEQILKVMEGQDNLEMKALAEAHHAKEEAEHEHEHHHHDHEDHEHHHHDHDHEDHEHHHDHDHEDHEHHHDHEHDENCTCGCHDHEHHHHHHADDVFTSWGKETPHKFERAKLEEVLKKFVDSDNILRSKGMVESTDGTWLYFDMVPGEYEIREGEPDYTGRIVVIGTEIHEDELLKTFGL